MGYKGVVGDKMVELAHQKSFRSGHRGIVTKKIAELEGALGDTPDMDALEAVENCSGEEAEIVAEVEGAEGIKDTLRAALFKVNKVIRPVATPPTASATATGGESSTSTVKLPKLKLAQFDGEYTKWKTFWDSFESAIHNRRDLIDIDKFTYLIPLLVRSAKEAIAGLSLTSANYHEAIDILKERFGDESQT